MIASATKFGTLIAERTREISARTSDITRGASSCFAFCLAVSYRSWKYFESCSSRLNVILKAIEGFPPRVGSDGIYQ